MHKHRWGTLLPISIMLGTMVVCASGCGKKGSLYLPDATQQQPDSEQSKKKSKKQK